MYSFDHVSKPDQITRIATGEVQCGHSHRERYDYYHSRPDARPAAAFVWFDKSYKSFLFACTKHNGSVKSAITRGTYAGRDLIDPADYGVDMGQIVKDPQAAIKVLLARIATEEEARSNRSRIAMAIHLGEQWEKRRAEYAADNTVEFLPFDMGDDYGLVKVGLKIGRGPYSSTTVTLTPAQLRKIIEFGDKWADNAERLTADAKPPTVTEQERAFLNEGAES